MNLIEFTCNECEDIVFYLREKDKETYHISCPICDSPVYLESGKIINEMQRLTIHLCKNKEKFSLSWEQIAKILEIDKVN